MQISISFNEITASKIHESQQVTLKNINCKTVLAALKKEHPDIISAKVERCEDSYTLAVQVKYDFLPPIEEVVKFEARKVSDSEMSELEIRNYFHEIKDLSSKVAWMLCSSTKSLIARSSKSSSRKKSKNS